MRRFYCTVWLIVLSITGFAGVAVASQTVQLSDSPSKIEIFDSDESGVRMRFEIGAIDFIPVTTEKGEFLIPRIDGFIKSNNIGEPDLPTANRMISIPFGCELKVTVEDFSMEEISLSDFGLTDRLIPAQPSMSKSQQPGDVPFEFNDAVYETDSYYARPQATAEVLGIMRSTRVGLISAPSFEYNPVQNSIKVYRNMTIRVEYQNPDWDLTYAKSIQHFSPFFEPVFGQIPNYEGLSSTRDTMTRYPVKYVIVSDRMFETQLEPFIAWKTKKGFNVQTYYTDVIGSTNMAIKNHLEGLYLAGTPEDPAPSFVLLVGDAGEIPPFSGTAGSHITDLYLCEFTGDIYPEILYGRFSAQTTALLQPQIDKTLEYEQYQMPDPSYLGEVIMIAGVDGTYAATHGNGQINYGTSLYFNAAHGIYSNTWLYPASAGAGVNDDIIDAINDGVGFANYTAHCGHNSWSDPYINTTDVNGFTNYSKYLLGIGNCCLSSTFAESTPCFGEAWMQRVGAGGIGYIGGSNNTYWDEDYYFGVGYGPVVGSGPSYEETGLGAYDRLFHDHGEPVGDHYVTNAALMYAGNLAVSASTSGRKTYYWEIYHVLGDPSVMTYLGVPSVNTVSYADPLLMTEPTITVNADPASYVGITVDGVLYGAGYVDETGQVVISLAEFTQPCVADIVVTGQNKQPFTAAIQVITPSGPYVIYNGDDVDDAIGGNGNGLIDYGESIVLGMELRNVGPDIANDVQATLSTEDTHITITDDGEFFGDINGNNGTAYISDAFGFDVAANAPDGHKVSFTATMVDINDSVWTSDFTLTIHAPILEYLAIDIDDATGNNNGVLDPGETGVFVITLQNLGSGDADDVAATIFEGDAYVSVGDDAGVFGQVAAGSTGDNALDIFVASADGSCPRGHEVVFQLDVTAANGFTTTLYFTIIIGDRVVFFSDDFSFDQGWSGLGGTGEWTIGPATGGAGDDSYGFPDPDVDHSPTSDNGVLGNDLTPGTGGDYSSGMGATYWVTSPVIDCADFNGVTLSFYRWLGVESDDNDLASFEGFDGESWVSLFQNSSTINESDWAEQVFDVSTIADSNGFFQVRYGIGPTDVSWNYCGWNIDDLVLKGYGERTSAEIALSTEELADSLIPGDIVEDTIVIYNNSAEAILRVTFIPDVGWITCDGGQQYIDPESSQEFILTVNSSGMDPGDYVGNVTYVSNDYSNQYDTLQILLHLYAPDVDIITSPLEEALQSGEQASQEVTINNVGPGRLVYEVGCQMFLGSGPLFVKAEVEREPLGIRDADDDKSDATESYFQANEKGLGGPDTFGYMWIDSDEPAGPTYSWVDISGTGSSVTLTDDGFVGPLAIGFDFPFYESSYNELYIGSNGILTFGSGSNSRLNTGMPSASDPDNLVAMWWDDLDPAEGGNVYYYYDAPGERFIISFDNIQNYVSGGGTGSLTFQAILHANGEVILQYSTMDPGTDIDGLTGATIGIENGDGSDGLEVVYNAEYMHGNLAISINAARWLSASPASGTIEPYSSAVLTVGFDAADMETGVYTGQVQISSNDPLEPICTIPVSMSVESFTCGDANGDGSVNVADAVMLINYVFKGGPPPDPLESGDANGDGSVDVADATMLINYVFKGGPPPIC